MTVPATGVGGTMQEWVCDGRLRCELRGCARRGRWRVPRMRRLGRLGNLRRLAASDLAGRGAEASQASGPRQASLNQVSIGNSVTSLRLLNALDWAVFFEAASPVEAVLRAE